MSREGAEQFMALVAGMPPRTMLVHSADGRWYVRGNVSVEQDITTGFRVYRCPTHLGAGDTAREALEQAAMRS